MDLDVRALIGLIVTAAIAGIASMSYVGAYLVGRNKGRSDVEREARLDEDRADARSMNADRLLVVEGAVDSVARAVERLADAQRVALLDRVRPVANAAAEVRAATPRVPGHNTPS